MRHDGENKRNIQSHNLLKMNDEPDQLFVAENKYINVQCQWIKKQEDAIVILKDVLQSKSEISFEEMLSDTQICIRI